MDDRVDDVGRLRKAGLGRPRSSFNDAEDSDNESLTVEVIAKPGCRLDGGAALVGDPAGPDGTAGMGGAEAGTEMTLAAESPPDFLDTELGDRADLELLIEGRRCQGGEPEKVSGSSDSCLWSVFVVAAIGEGGDRDLPVDLDRIRLSSYGLAISSVGEGD